MQGAHRIASRARHRWLLLVALACLATACGTSSRPEADPDHAASRPADAVRLLTRHLHDNDLPAFARDALPAELHARLEIAWRQRRTRWPLDELPLQRRLPAMLAALSAPDAQRQLQQAFGRQFAHADKDLAATASALGLFAVQYVRHEGQFSAAERDHYAQLATALSGWAQAAPLADPQRARQSIALLSVAARRAGLASEQDFASAGMDDSLRRLTPVLVAAKRALALYGLELDDSLRGMDAQLQTQTGDSARVRMRYTLGGKPIDTVVDVERRGGRWYVRDFLRHAEAATLAPAPKPR